MKKFKFMLAAVVMMLMFVPLSAQAAAKKAEPKKITVQPTIINYNDFTITWNKVKDAEKYEVHWEDVRNAEHRTSALYWSLVIDQYKTTKKTKMKIVPKDVTGSEYSRHRKFKVTVTAYNKDSKVVGKGSVKFTTAFAPMYFGMLHTDYKTMAYLCVQGGFLDKNSHYVIYKSKTKNGKYEKVLDTKSNCIIDTTTTKKTDCWYKVRAYCVINGKRVWTDMSLPTHYKYGYYTNGWYMTMRKSKPLPYSQSEWEGYKTNNKRFKIALIK